MNTFDSFDIELLLVTVLSVGVKYGNTIMIMTEKNFGLVLWIYERSCCFLTHCTTLVY